MAVPSSDSSKRFERMEKIAERVVERHQYHCPVPQTIAKGLTDLRDAVQTSEKMVTEKITEIQKQLITGQAQFTEHGRRIGDCEDQLTDYAKTIRAIALKIILAALFACVGSSSLAFAIAKLVN
jgi:hypothetical protein